MTSVGDADARGPAEAPGRLSDREVAVAALVAEGLTNAEVAARLGLSPRTVQAHVASAREKLGARSRTHLAVLALRRGLLPLHPREPTDEGQ